MEEVNHLYAFEKLKVWEEIRTLVKIIYSLTKNYPKEEQFCLVNQLRRAIVSVSSNIVEGSSRTSPKDQAHFYQLSYSSLMEVLSQIIVSRDLCYVDEKVYREIRMKIQSVSYLINQLRKSTLTKPTKPTKLSKPSQPY